MYDVPGDRVKYQHPEGFMNWLRALLGPNGRSRTIRKRNPFSQPSRPELEGLETRFLLATGITEFASLPTTSSQPDAVTAGPGWPNLVTQKPNSPPRPNPTTRPPPPHPPPPPPPPPPRPPHPPPLHP